MPNFYLTFGQKYRHEPHPLGGHPDGWFTITAPDKSHARELIFQLCGPQWAFLYSEREFDATHRACYPLGELKLIDYNDFPQA